MPELSASKIISLLYSLSIVAIAFSLYTEYPMESDDICHQFSAKNSIKLSDLEDGGVIVRPDHMFDPWIASIDKLCKYVIKTDSHTGLFAVIQNMSFRHNGSRCIDYVQFKEGGQKSKFFCGESVHGNFKFESIYGNPETTIDGLNLKRWNSTRPEFRSPKGELETHIFISKEKLREGEKLDISIVYTPYKDCSKLKDKSKYRRNRNNTCIEESFYCDGYRNCAYDLCLDEGSCEVLSKGTGTKVAIGAVTTLFLASLLFVICLWSCRRHKKLCWSYDCAGPNVNGGNAQPIDLGPRDSNSRSAIPTAPMLDATTTRSVHDKDLPPSYDSLFPEQPSPAVM